VIVLPGLHPLEAVFIALVSPSSRISCSGRRDADRATLDRPRRAPDAAGSSIVLRNDTRKAEDRAPCNLSMSDRRRDAAWR